MAAATAVAQAEAVEVETSQIPAVEFNNSRIVEMSMQWLRPGGDKSLMSYFQSVFPVAGKYGVRALGRLIPEKAVTGDLMPHVIGMVEWPELASFDGFMKDADYRRLYPQRDEALERLIVTHLRSVTTASVRFDPDKVYELSGLWIRPDGGRERLSDYIAQIEPVAAEYGARPVAQFTGVRSAWGDFLPTEVHLTEWVDRESSDRFRSDSRAESLRSLRETALSKLTITQCSVQAVGH